MVYHGRNERASVDFIFVLQCALGDDESGVFGTKYPIELIYEVCEAKVACVLEPEVVVVEVVEEKSHICGDGVDESLVRRG